MGTGLPAQLLFLKRTGENFFYVPQDNRDIALFLSLLAVGIIAQVYRYLRHSTPVQRQQRARPRARLDPGEGLRGPDGRLPGGQARPGLPAGLVAER